MIIINSVLKRSKKILYIFSLFLGARERLISGGSALYLSIPLRSKKPLHIKVTNLWVHSTHWWQWQAALKPLATHWCTLDVESSHSLGTVCILFLVLLESQSQHDIDMRPCLLNWMLPCISSNSHVQNRYAGIFLKETRFLPSKARLNYVHKNHSRRMTTEAAVGFRKLLKTWSI